MMMLADTKTECASSSSTTKVYRYNFRPEFVSILCRFAKVHQYDSSEDFKEAFEKWETTYHAEIKGETEYLEDLGYVGDFRTKAYKSARYYFRKKDIADMDCVSTLSEGKQIQRKKYTSIDYDLSTKIAEYLETFHSCKPSDGFSEFCEMYKKEVDAEVLRLEGEGENGLLKIKKTFKNKHFNKKREILQRNETNN
jgi:hypothetical protein